MSDLERDEDLPGDTVPQGDVVELGSSMRASLGFLKLAEQMAAGEPTAFTPGTPLLFCEACNVNGHSYRQDNCGPLPSAPPKPKPAARLQINDGNLQAIAGLAAKLREPMPVHPAPLAIPKVPELLFIACAQTARRTHNIATRRVHVDLLLAAACYSARLVEELDRRRILMAPPAPAPVRDLADVAEYVDSHPEMGAHQELASPRLCPVCDVTVSDSLTEFCSAQCEARADVPDGAGDQ